LNVSASGRYAPKSHSDSKLSDVQGSDTKFPKDVSNSNCRVRR
jgi:hypothetical protein